MPSSHMSSSGRHATVGTEMGDSFAAKLIAPRRRAAGFAAEGAALPLSRWGQEDTAAAAEPKLPARRREEAQRRRQQQSKLVLPSHAGEQPLGLSFSEFIPSRHKAAASDGGGGGGNRDAASTGAERIAIAEALLAEAPRRKVREVLTARLSELKVLRKCPLH